MSQGCATPKSPEHLRPLGAREGLILFSIRCWFHRQARAGLTAAENLYASYQYAGCFLWRFIASLWSAHAKAQRESPWLSVPLFYPVLHAHGTFMQTGPGAGHGRRAAAAAPTAATQRSRCWVQRRYRAYRAGRFRGRRRHFSNPSATCRRTMPRGFVQEDVTTISANPVSRDRKPNRLCAGYTAVERCR